MVVSELMLGAVLGFVLFVPSFPLFILLQNETGINERDSMYLAAALVATMTCYVAALSAHRGREWVVTNEELAIINRHTRKAFTHAAFYAIPSPLLLLVGFYLTDEYLFVFAAYYTLVAWVAVAALVGRSRGKAIVKAFLKALELSRRGAVNAISDRQLEQWSDMRSEDRRHDDWTGAEVRYRKGEPKHLADMRLED